MALAPDWARIANTTIPQFVRGRIDNLVTGHKLFNLMRQRGRISYGNSGDYLDFKVRFKRAPVSGWTPTDTISFARVNRHKTAQLRWNYYVVPDAMDWSEELKNRGTEAIVKISADIATGLMDDIETRISEEIWQDGYASGNSLRLIGFNSCTGNNSTSSSLPIAVCDDQYAGLDTDLAAYGGSISSGGVWPGVGTWDDEYAFWSPILIDYTSANSGTAGWTNSTKTFPNTGREAIQFGIIHRNRTVMRNEQIDLVVLESELFRELQISTTTNERLVVVPSGPQGSYSLGYRDMVNINGVEVTHEYGVPATQGFGFAINTIELRCMLGQLFEADTVEFDIATKTWRHCVNFAGQLQFNPARMFKLDNYT